MLYDVLMCCFLSSFCLLFCVFFFFQAEDGIRDRNVTGVQTCALPIFRWRDGTVIWSGPSDAGYWDAMPEPGGQRIAVSVRDPQHPQTGGYPPHNVYVVGPDGKAIPLLTDVE